MQTYTTLKDVVSYLAAHSVDSRDSLTFTTINKNKLNRMILTHPPQMMFF